MKGIYTRMIAAAAMAAAVGVLLTAMAGTAVSAEEMSHRFVLAGKNLSESYNFTLASEIRSRIEARGDTLVIYDGEGDGTLQMGQVTEAVGSHPDGIFLHTVGGKNAAETVDLVREAGIPLIGVSKELKDMSGLTSFAGTDNYQAGQLVGQTLAALFPDGGNILILTVEGDETLAERTDGIKDALKDTTVAVAGELGAAYGRRGSKASIAGALEAYPDLTAIAAGEDSLALGALDALRESGDTHTVVISIGGSPDMKTEMSKGEPRLIGTAALSPAAIADAAVELMYAAVSGQTLRDRYLIQSYLITPGNLAEYGTEGWQ